MYYLLSILLVVSLADVDELEASSFDEALASKLFYLTSASYCSRQKILTWTCGKPCKQTQQLQDITIFINATNENAGIAAYDPSTNEIFLVFRGTLPWSITNWIEDIDFIKTEYPYCDNGCQVHRGFYESYLGIEQQVFYTLRAMRNRYPDAQITVTGHSLGGALATHALAILTAQGFKIKNFYTFGSPRVGDPKFSQWMSKRLYTSPKWRVTHNRDPVPHLPFLDWEFQHVSQEAYYKDILIIHKAYAMMQILKILLVQMLIYQILVFQIMPLIWVMIWHQNYQHANEKIIIFKFNKNKIMNLEVFFQHYLGMKQEEKKLEPIQQENIMTVHQIQMKHQILQKLNSPAYIMMEARKTNKSVDQIISNLNKQFDQYSHLQQVDIIQHAPVQEDRDSDYEDVEENDENYEDSQLEEDAEDDGDYDDDQYIDDDDNNSLNDEMIQEPQQQQIDSENDNDFQDDYLVESQHQLQYDQYDMNEQFD